MKSADHPLSELWPTQSAELLKALHILTRDGKLNQDSRRKLKQVQHLVQLITPSLEGLQSLADLGAGKSYLGFILYDLWMRNRSETRLWNVEQRPELVGTGRRLANSLGFDRVTFVPESILSAMSSSDIPQTLDAVTALHACDTATDEAIVFALQKQAKFIALVPCCQAEVARLLERTPPSDMESLWRHGLHRREFGSHLTNVVRGLYLEAEGYKVRVTELTGWEHSMKNEILLAKRTGKPNERSRRQLEDLRARLPLDMRLFQLRNF